jgi:hypothetical protein
MKMKKTFLILLLAVAVVSSCKKDDNNDNNNNTNTPPNTTPDPFSLALTTSSTLFYKATVDGVSQFYKNGENNVSIAYDFQNFRNLPSPPPNITYLYPNSSFILDNDVDIFTLMSLRFELSINNNETSFTEFKNRFSLGNMAFANQPPVLCNGTPNQKNLNFQIK